MTTVLIIEDDHDTRVSLRSALEDEGFTVISATDGTHGYEQLKQIKTPVVVLLDQNMPLANGEEFMDLKEADPSLQNVPVIVSSAVGNRLADRHVAAYFSKPYHYPDLIAAIRANSPAAYWSPENRAS